MQDPIRELCQSIATEKDHAKLQVLAKQLEFAICQASLQLQNEAVLVPLKIAQELKAS